MFSRLHWTRFLTRLQWILPLPISRPFYRTESTVSLWGIFLVYLFKWSNCLFICFEKNIKVCAPTNTPVTPPNLDFLEKAFSKLNSSFIATADTRSRATIDSNEFSTVQHDAAMHTSKTNSPQIFSTFKN